MNKLIKIRDKWNNDFTVNIAMLSIIQDLGENKCVAFGGFNIEISTATYNTIIEEFNKVNEMQQDKLQTPCFELNSDFNKPKNIREIILVADYIDAEAKLKLLMQLGV